MTSCAPRRAAYALSRSPWTAEPAHCLCRAAGTPQDPQEHPLANELPLDHIVLGVPHLEDGAEEFERSTGLRPVFGGRHATGTANYLVDLGGEAYLEILGLMPDARGNGQVQPFGIEHVRRPRLLTFCLRSGDIERDAASAKERGHDVGEVLSLSRTSPDGARLNWKMSRRQPMAAGGVVPFLMDWGRTPHPTTRGLPSASLLDLRISHPDPDSVAASLRAVGSHSYEVGRGPGGLRATIDTPNGVITLN